VDAKGGSLCSDLIHETAESRPWSERLTRRTGSMDHRKVSGLERLLRQHRIAVHQRRTAHSHHDLLGHRVDWYLIPPLLRLRECERADVGKGRYQGHFAAMEEPQLLADDIRAWFGVFRHEP
jgi:hypothetical protein